MEPHMMREVFCKPAVCGTPPQLWFDAPATTDAAHRNRTDLELRVSTKRSLTTLG